jgi:hypothetical protein
MGQNRAAIAAKSKFSLNSYWSSSELPLRNRRANQLRKTNQPPIAAITNEGEAVAGCQAIHRDRLFDIKAAAKIPGRNFSNPTIDIDTIA